MSITLAFYKGRKRDNPRAKFFDNVICAVDGGPYSHVEFVDPADLQGWSSSFRDGGVRRKAIDWNNGSWVFVTVDGCEPEDVRQLLRPCLGMPYDLWGLLFFVFPYRLEQRSKMFCSEVVAYGLELEDPWSYSPNDLMMWVMTFFPQAVKNHLPDL